MLGRRLAFITGIDEKILLSTKHQNLEERLDEVPVAVRMSCAARRATTRIEDIAYCFLDIFGINLLLLYGEGVCESRMLICCLDPLQLKPCAQRFCEAWNLLERLHKRGLANFNRSYRIGRSYGFKRRSPRIVTTWRYWHGEQLMMTTVLIVVSSPKNCGNFKRQTSLFSKQNSMAFQSPSALIKAWDSELSFTTALHRIYFFLGINCFEATNRE